MNLKIIFSLIFLTAVSVSVRAQSSSTTHYTPAFSQIGIFAWDVNFSQNDFAKETSLSGGTFGYRKMVKSNVSLGFEVGWASFADYKPRQTYQVKNGAVTTDLYQYMYTVPMVLNTHYYWGGENKKVYPFVGIGLGATYAQQELYYNTYVTTDDQWGFLVRPEVGALIKVDPHGDWAILVGARYSYSTNKQTEFKIDDLKAIGLQLGVAWSW